MNIQKNPEGVVPPIGKEIMHIRRAVTSDNQTIAIAESLSKELGGAWVYFVLPTKNGFEANFFQFQSPSKVPDSFFDSSHNRIFVDGKQQPFSHAAYIREQNRGLGNN